MRGATKLGFSLAVSLTLSTAAAWTGPTASVLDTPFCKTYGCRFLEKFTHEGGSKHIPKATTQYHYFLTKLPYRDAPQEYLKNRQYDVFTRLDVWRHAATGAIHEVGVTWNANDFGPGIARGQLIIATLTRMYVSAATLRKLGFSSPEALARRCYTGRDDPYQGQADTTRIACGFHSDELGPVGTFSFGIY